MAAPDVETVGPTPGLILSMLERAGGDPRPAAHAADLRDAYRQAERLIAVSDADFPLAEAHFLAGWAKSDLYQLTEEPAELDDAVAHLRCAVFTAPMSYFVDEFVGLLRERHRLRTDDGVDDLDEAVRTLRTTLAGMSATDDEHLELTTVLGLVLTARFLDVPQDAPGKWTDFAEAMNLLTDGQLRLPATHPMRPELAADLGMLHLQNFFRSPPGEPADQDLDRAIRLLDTVADHDPRSARGLAAALSFRHSMSRRPDDRTRAVTILEALCADPGTTPDDLVDLAEFYLDELDETYRDETVDRTVELLERAWAAEGADLELVATTMVRAYASRRPARPHELNRLVEVATEMLGNGVDWAELLAVALAERAVYTDDPEHLRSAVAQLTEVLPNGRPDQWGWGELQMIQASLIARTHGAPWPLPEWSPIALTEGVTDEQAEVVRHRFHEYERLVLTSAQRYPEYVACVAVFEANFVQSRIRRGADIPLAEPIAVLERALELLPPGHPMTPAVALHLGTAYAESGNENQRHDHTERGLDLLTTAAESMTADNPARVTCVGLLGVAAISAYSAGVVRIPLDRAETLLVEVVGDPDLHPAMRAGFLGALGQMKSLRWLVDPTNGDMGQGLALQEQALSLLTPESPMWADIRFSIALMLAARSELTADRRDLDLAERHLEAIEPLVADRPANDFTNTAAVTDLRDRIRLLRMRDVEPADIDDAEIDRIADRLTSGQDGDDAAKSLLGHVNLMRARKSGSRHQLQTAVEQMSGVLDSLPPTHPMRPMLMPVGSLQGITEAIHNGDRQAAGAALEAAEAQAAAPDLSADERCRQETMIGLMWNATHTTFHDPEALDRAIDVLARARWRDVVSGLAVHAAEQLANAYWTRGGPGDVDRCLDAGFDALHLHARQVLLQSGVAYGASEAGAAAGFALVLAHRCMAAGRLDSAVAAVEAGRGLAMHVATSGADVAELLRELGHEPTAAEWELTAQDGEETDVLGDLRHRVLSLLAGTDAERRLLDPPGPPAIAASLRETGADVLVYLVPGTKDGGGRALFVTADARVGSIALPLLDVADGGEVARYLSAYQQAMTPAPTRAEQEFASRRWRRELDELLRWAWPAVADPVLTEVERWGLPGIPHLVLVPCDSLGIVPWHAARGEGSRHALGRAAFSYAASARQLGTVAERPARDPREAPVVVADPTGDLSGGEREALYLYQRCYPNGLYLGLLPEEVPRDGVGTPEEVLAQLPGPSSAGASLLHLGCHAHGGPNPAQSYLTLVDSEPLTVATVLRRAHHLRANAPGGLVVLAACRSDLSDREHDEALTLATAFLAAGAASVVGTRWEVDDRSSAVLMCLFHRFLVVDRLAPAYALRATQLWALDPNRTLPPDIAAVLPPTYPTGVDLATWAAFTHQGR